MSSADIARLRQQLKYSQSVFARVLNVSPKTVQAWEQGIRVPSDAALKLLSIAKRHPEVLLEAWGGLALGCFFPQKPEFIDTSPTPRGRRRQPIIIRIFDSIRSLR